MFSVLQKLREKSIIESARVIFIMLADLIFCIYIFSYLIEKLIQNNRNASMKLSMQIDILYASSL